MVAYPQCRNGINMWVYMILIKRHEKFLYLDQQGLKKLKTNKQILLWLIVYECVCKYLALVGIYHH
jgi:hypothetical protein